MSGSDPSLPPPAAEKAGRGQFPRKQHQRDREMGGGGGVGGKVVGRVPGAHAYYWRSHWEVFLEEEESSRTSGMWPKETNFSLWGSFIEEAF